MVLRAQLASTVFMTGAIWWVQIIHYPLFAQVGPEAFTSYHKRHVDVTGWVVIPPMLLELGTAFMWVALQPSSVLAWLGLALLGLVWASTFFVQVPLHGRLQQGLQPESIRSLVASNWLRTVGWTARAALLLAVV